MSVSLVGATSNCLIATQQCCTRMAAAIGPILTELGGTRVQRRSGMRKQPNRGRSAPIAHLLRKFAITLSTCVFCTIAAVAETPRDTLVLGWDISPVSTLDPDVNNSGTAAGILSNVCDPLVFRDYEDATKFVPGLVRSWTVGKDRLTWRFSIRPEIRFASGRNMTAQDVVWSIQRALRLQNGGINGESLRRIGYQTSDAETHFRVLDNFTFEIRAKNQLAEIVFLEAFERIAVLDRISVLSQQQNGDLGSRWLSTTSACAGPFSVTQWNANNVIILTKNKQPYWRHTIAIERVVIRHIPQSASQRLLLEKGDIDVALNVNPADLPAIRRNPRLRLVIRQSPNIFFLGLNQKHEILRKPQIREAFRNLIDYGALAQTFLRDIAIIRQDFVPAGAFGAIPPSRPFNLDVAKSRRLLAEAGFPKGFSIELVVRSQPPQIDVAQSIQASAAQVGIDIRIRSMSDAMLYSVLRSRTFQLCLTGFTFTPDASTSAGSFALNLDNGDNSKRNSAAWMTAWDVGRDSNELVQQAQVEQDTNKRQLIYYRLQEGQRKNAPLIPIYQLNRVFVVSSAVAVLKTNGVNVFYPTAVKR